MSAQVAPGSASGSERREASGTLVSDAYMLASALILPTQKPGFAFGMTPVCGPRLGRGKGGGWAY